MHVTVDIEKGRHHSVTIHSSFPHIHLCISAEQALDILRALNVKEAEMMDMAHNYYDCGECGQTHPKHLACRDIPNGEKNSEEDEEDLED